MLSVAHNQPTLYNGDISTCQNHKALV